jgi:two-component system, sensor histidine kinase
MNRFHKLLERQINKYLGEEIVNNPGVLNFLAAVSESYNSFERDKELFTHSFNISEREYQEVNRHLHEAVELKKKSIHKLKEAIKSIDYENEIELSPESDDLLIVVNYLDEQIKKRREIENQLRDLSLVSQQTSNMVIIADANQRIVWVNKAFSETSGYTLEEIRGKKPGQVLQGKNTDPKTVNEIRTALREGQNFHGQLINYNKKGVGYWNELSINPIKDAQGNIEKFISISTDVTDRIIRNEELLKSELKWKIAIEGSGGGVFEYDVRQDMFTCSDNLKNLFDLSIDVSHLSSQQLLSFIHPENRYKNKKAFLQVLSGTAVSFNQELSLKSGHNHYVSVLVKAIATKYDENGMPTHLLGISTNITEIKQTQIELANRVRQFKGLSENIPAVIYEYQFNRDGTEGFRYISPAIEKVFGISVADFMAHGVSYIHPDDRDRFIYKNNLSRISREPFFDEARLVIPGKGIVWQSVSSSYTYDTQEGSSVYTGIISDITGEKNAAVALKVNEEKYRGIITNMHLGLLEVDNNDLITYANNAFCKLSGYDLAELVGRKAGALLVADTAIIESSNLRRKKNISDAYEIQVKDKEGRMRWWFVSGAPRYKDNGELIGSVGIHLDITEQKELETSLVKAREEAIRLAKTKETFLANMSHEIRTPLNGIIGMIRELGKMEPTQAQRLYLNNASTSSQHLLSIINNILDLSKIEAGVFDLEQKSFSLRQVFSEVKNMVATSAQEKMLDINFHVPDGLAKNFIGDASRLRQILLNIISNCIKFTERGYVKVDCRVDETNQEEQAITITIADSGIGMDEAFLKTIFNKFTQENDSIQRKYGGTGLGMAITYELVHLMHGQIQVSSQKGKGSQFDIQLRLRVNMEDDNEESVSINYASALSGKKILLVEDNEMNRLVVSHLLGHFHVVITEAVNGVEALEKVKQDHFDLILMDMQMPVMDGLEATRAIRKQQITIPIVALTANAFKSEVDKCLAVGMNDFVTKPFDEENLLRTISVNMAKAELSSLSNAKKTAVTSTSDKLYDLTRLHSMAHGNEKFVSEILKIFSQDVPQVIQTLETALQNQDSVMMHKIAHKAKPSVMEMGIHSIIDDIRYLEATKQFDSLMTDKVKKVTDTLRKVVEQLTQEMT